MSVGLKFFENGNQYMIVGKRRKRIDEKKKSAVLPIDENAVIPDSKAAMGSWLDSRRAPRADCSVFVDFSASGRVFQEKITDISISGAFIETRAGLGIDDEISMIISVPGKPVKIKARIARKTPAGFGVEFRNRLNLARLAS